MVLSNILTMCEIQGVHLESNDTELIVTFDEYPSDELLGLLKKYKSDLLDYLADLTGKIQNTSEFSPIKKVSREINNYELSFPQQRLWIIDQLDGGSSQYNLSAAIAFEGPLDINTVQKALYRIIERHEPLRTIFKNEHGVKQAIQNSVNFQLVQGDLSNVEPASREAVLKKIISSEIIKPFDLSSDILLRANIWKLTKTSGVFVINMHHIASDGWSLGILIKEFMQQYEAISAGQPDPFQPLDIQYVDFAQWQRSRLGSEGLKEQIAHWHKQLSHLPKIHSLPLDKARPKIRSFSGKSYTFNLDTKLTLALKELAKSEKVTPFMVIHGAFALLLSVYSNERDIVIGTPVANRLHKELEGLIGFFANTIILRSNLKESFQLTISEYLQYIKDINLDAQSNQEIPFEYLVEQLNPERDTSYNPLFQIMFSMNNTRQKNITLSDISLTPISVENAAAKFDLSLEASELNNEIRLMYEYSTDLFDSAIINQLAATLTYILTQFTDSSYTKICDLEWVTDNERIHFLAGQNATQKVRPRDVCIHQLIETQVEKAADSIALVCESERVSYRALNERANRLAHCLREKGVVADTLVGVFMERSLEMVVALLAVLKAGGAYVPFEPGFPEARVQFMVEDSGVELVLTHSSLREAAALHQVESLCVDDLALFQDYATTNPVFAPSLLSPSNLAYVIYTSGSTGQPKGVMVEHDGLVNRIDWMQNEYKLSDRDKVLQKTPYSFDVSVWEFFWPLATGAQLVIARPEGHKDPVYLSQLIQDEGITTLHFVPSMFRAMLSDGDWSSCRSVRQVFCSGEALTAELVRGHYAVHEGGLHNLYGPTEATIDVSYWACSAGVSEGVVPIGKPIQNTQLYVLNAQAQLLPQGAIGELYIGGEGVARGYLNRPELTAQRFIEDTFQKNTDGKRLYKTGDLVRLLADGNLDYIGRIDNQVKINGLRIELDEIKEQLAQVEGVDAALVVIRGGVQSPKIIAYVVPGDTGLVNQPVAGNLHASDEFIKTLERHLKHVLPGYMQPSDVVLIESIPLTFNGKVDYKALPDADALVRKGDSYSPPRTELEEQLCEIWSDLLKVDRVGITDNFFSLGGDSILSIQAVARANRSSIKITTQQLLKHQTIELLSASIKEDQEIIIKPDVLVEGELQLLPIQRRFFHNTNHNRSHFNQSILLSAPDKLCHQILFELINAILLKHDSFRLRFSETQKQWKSTYSPINENYIKDTFIVDRLPENSEHISLYIEQKCSQYQQSLSIEDGPLCKFIYFEGAHIHRVFIVIHHLIMDGVSWRILLSDFDYGYQQAVSGEKIDLGPKGNTYQEFSAKLLNHFSSRDLSKDKSFWLSQLNVVVPKIPSDKIAIVDITQKTTHVFTFTLPEKETEFLISKSSQAFGTRIEELLLSGIFLGISLWTKSTSIRLDIEGHGRDDIAGELDLTKTIGWFTKLYPLTLSVSSLEPSGVIKTIKEQYRSTESNGLSYGVMRYMLADPDLADLGQKSPSQMMFNYLGQMDQMIGTDSHFTLALEATGAAINPEYLREYALHLDCMVFNGKLNFLLSYSELEYEESTISHVAKLITAGLTSVIEECQKTHKTIYTPCDFPFSQIDQKELDIIQDHYEVAKLYPATSMQQGMYFHSLMEQSAYVNQTCFNIKGKFNPALFQQAWGEMIKKYDTFRTQFLGEPLQQLVLKQTPLTYFEKDLTAYSNAEQQDYLASYLSKDKSQGFNFNAETLHRIGIFKLSEVAHRVIWTYHHMLFDGWSLRLILGELMDVYQTINEKRPSMIAEPVAYEPYLQWLQQQDLEVARNYWKDYLKNIDAPTPLIIDRLPKRNQSGFDRKTLFLSEAKTLELVAFAQANQTTISTLLQVVWGYILHIYSGESEPLFGVTISGRPASIKNIEKMVGLFINTIPVKISFDEPGSLGDLLRKTHLAFQNNDQYGYLSLNEIQKQTQIDNSIGLFNSLLVFENFHLNYQDKKTYGEETEIGDLFTHEQTNYDLTVNIVVESQLSITLSYMKETLGSDGIERLLGHFEEVLTHISSANDIFEIGILTSVEEKQISLWNNTAWQKGHISGIHGLFLDQVKKQPHSIAIKDQFGELSYADLFAHAHTISQKLQQLGLSREALVAVYLPKGRGQVIATLGIMMAGAAYLPLDTKWPEERCSRIISKANCYYAIVNDESSTFCPELMDFIYIADIALTNNDPYDFIEKYLNDQQGTSLAYVIFTSGSTGTPKGVAIEHQSAVNTLLDINAQYKINQQDSVLAVSSLSFDLSVYDLFGLLAAGGEIVFPDDEFAQDPQHWYESIANNKITVWNTVPAAAGLLVDHIASQDEIALGSLKRVLLSGDWIPPKLPTDLLMYFPHARVYSLGGATEGSIWSIHYPIEQDMSSWSSIPYGKPLSNQSFYIVDKNRHLCPIGVIGELLIGGEGLAREYYSDATLTQERFYYHEKIGKRVYRTGDLGRYYSDGNIEFVGRVDDQVKIRGFRIELGEIEVCLSKAANVKENVVIALKENNENNRLVAYVVLNDTQTYHQHNNALIDSFKAFLAKQLPHYMVPSVFIILEKLPLSLNGKIDRKALPKPKDGDFQTQQYVVPRNEIEEKLCVIWQHILRLERIGTFDNFFSLGGDSILAMQAVSQAKKAGVNITVKQMYSYPTIAQLSLVSKIGAVQPAQNYASTGELRLLPIQQDFFAQKMANPSHYNQSVLLRTPSDFNVVFLENIFTAICHKHDVLRLMFTRNEGKVRAQFRESITDIVDNALSSIDLSHLNNNDKKAQLESIAEQLQASLDIETGVLVKITYFNYGNEDGRLLLIFHHLLIDGVSWRTLLSDFELAYQQLRDGENISLGNKTSAFQHWSELLKNYAELRIPPAEREYWISEISSAKNYNRIEDPHVSKAVFHYDFHINEGKTTSLLGACNKAYRTKTNELLIASLLLAYHQWHGSSSMLLEIESHGREELFDGVDVAETVGWFTSLYPLALDAPLDISIGELIKSVKEKCRAVPNQGIGYGLLKYTLADVDIVQLLPHRNNLKIVFNYLGQFDSSINSSTNFSLADESTGSNIGAENVVEKAISFNGGILNGELRFGCTSYMLNNNETTQFFQFFKSSIEALITFCEEKIRNNEMFEKHKNINLSEISNSSIEGVEI